MKNFFEGFKDYLVNIGECLMLIGAFTFAWIVIFIYGVLSSITGQDRLFLISQPIIDMFENITNSFKKLRESKIDKAIKELDE